MSIHFPFRGERQRLVTRTTFPVAPPTWRNVADFREQLRLLEPRQVLEIIEMLRGQVMRCSRKAPIQ